MREKLERIRYLMEDWGGVDDENYKYSGELYGERLYEAYKLVLELINELPKEGDNNAR